jgi:formimidoylglutamate deiminase
MNNRRIYCRTLLQGDQWRNDVILILDVGGVITRIEQGLPSSADLCIYGIVVPGMPNVHSHSFQRLLAGKTGPGGNQNDSFWSWREAMYRYANGLSPDQFMSVTAWVFVQMLKAGFTSVAEFHYVHHQPGGASYANPAEMSERLFEAAAQSGMAMTLLPVLYCSSGFGHSKATKIQKRFTNSPERYLDLVNRCQEVIRDKNLLGLGMAPHSLRAVPASALQEVFRCWPVENSPVHIHIAEQPAEVNACLEYTGLRPVEWLLEEYSVDHRWCLVHATHMSGSELRSAAASGSVAGLCPTTEADLGDGVFPAEDWINAGGQFAIGTDSNVRISVAEELRLLEFNARLGSGRRNVLTGVNTTCGRFLYQQSARAGGLAIGQPVGVLESGFRADLLELDGNHELLFDQSPDIALDTWIFAGSRSMINSVWVAGNPVIENGLHAGEQALRAAYSKVVKDFKSV